MKKRWLSILLVCGMLLTTLPSTVFAEGEGGAECVCTAACTAEARNPECPTCGAEDAALEDCAQYKGEQENELKDTQEPAEPKEEDQEGDQEAQPEETDPTEEPTVEAEPQVAAQAVADDKTVAVQAEHTHCFCGGSISAGGHTSHSDVTYTAWNGTSGINYTNKVAYVYLTGNATMNNDLVVDGKTLYLCLNGKTLSSNGAKKLKVRNNARLVLCDCQGGGAIKGVSSGWGGGCVYLYNSTLDMFGGKLTGAKVKHGGGVALDDKNCTLNLYGGSISGNTATIRGGGVYMLNGGTVNLYGGSISNNTASGTGTKGLGGGVFLEAGSGSINLHGGSISNNTAKGVYGGGIYLNSAGTVTITGGEISGNKLVNTGNGGGICLNKDGAKLVMSGGSIKNNSASVGAGVNFANGGTFTLSGGSITGNIASGDGGGVRLFRNVTFNITGGEISGNKSGAGGGVQMEDNSSTLNISGAPVIKDNTVSGKANNVQLPSGKTLTINGAMSSGASIGVTTEDTNYPVVFSNAYSADYSDYFFSDAGKAIHYNSSKQLEIGKDAAHTHTGGTATCTKKAVCATCGKEYGELNPANHSGTLSNWQTSDTEHWQVYSCCKVEANRAAHSGGMADCQHKAVCETCETAYGSLGNHTFIAETADEQYLKTAATCTEKAIYYKSCTVCGEKGTETFTVGTPLDHDWNAWTQNNDQKTHTRVCKRDASHTETDNCSGGTATCTAKAVCTTCNGEYGEMKAHDFTAETVDAKYLKSASSCTEPAVYYKSCTACGLSSKGTADEETFSSGNVLGHDYGAWKSNGNGTHTRICSNDSSHTETDDCSGGTATCTELATCTDCGGTYGELAAHDFTAEVAEEPYLKSEATCTEAAVYYKSCTACGLASKDTFQSGNPLGHDYGAWKSNNNGTHTRICSNDSSHTENGTCSGGTATCTELATCTVCGGTYGQLAAHDFTAEVAEEPYLKSEATCTEAAVYYKSCTACGLASEDTFQSGNPLGHDYDTKWSQDETHHWHVCQRCQDIADLEAHTASGWITDKAATAKVDGEKHKECTVCGYILETDTIPATGSKTKPGKKDDAKSDTKNRVKTNAPKTGDDSTLLLWTALLGVSGVGVTGVVRYGRKRKDNE